MSQEELEFERTARLANAWRRWSRTLADAVESVGLIVAAGACDCSKSELRDALSCREGRYLRGQWILAIAEVASPEQRLTIGNAYLGWQGLAAGYRITKTPEERLADLESAVAHRFGPAGLELVKESRR